MTAQSQGGPRWRAHALNRASESPSPAPSPLQTGHSRSKSTFTSSIDAPPKMGLVHQRTQSFSPGPGSMLPSRSDSMRRSVRGNTPTTGTFAPTFIKSEDMQSPLPTVDRIEGENDFSGKRYVWLRDSTQAFVRGWVVQELDGDRLLVQCDDGNVGTCTYLRPGQALTSDTAT
jgi:myosin protein heavy chain